MLIIRVRSLQSLGKLVGAEQTRGGSMAPALSAQIPVSPEMLGGNQRRGLQSEPGTSIAAVSQC